MAQVNHIGRWQLMFVTCHLNHAAPLTQARTNPRIFFEQVT